MRASFKTRCLQANLSKWMVPSLLLLGLPSSLAHPTYPWRDPQTNERRECGQCPPGTYVGQACTAEEPTVCQPCPADHYTEFWNYLGQCLYCNIFCYSLEEEVRPCNATHNRECQCKPGYHAEWDFCKGHAKCPLGSGVVALGNPQEDTKCAPCPLGTFSGAASSTERCKPHQDCSARGLEVNVPGNQFHDTLCTSCKPSEDEQGGDSLGTGDCVEALLDFVPYKVKSTRRLHRLKRILSNSTYHSGMDHRKRPEELQVELHNYLTQLKNTEGKESAARRLRRALERMRLQHLLEKIEKHFPVGL